MANANPVKGEVAFESGGKGYRFQLGTYALAALQRRTKMPTGKFFNRPADEWGVDDILAVFHAGLLRHHDLSERQASDMVDDLGNDRINEIIMDAIALAFPAVRDTGVANGSGGPPEARAPGTGKDS